MTAPLVHPVRAADEARVARLADAPARVLDRLRHHPDATVFHQPGWMRAVEAGTGHRAHVAWVERGDEVVAALPLTLVTSRLFGRALVGSGFGVDGGALVDDADGAHALSAAARAFAEEVRAPVELRGGEPLPHFAAAPQTHVTFARPLAGDRDALLKAIPRKQRAEVRRSFTRGLAISHGSDEAHRRAHYSVYATSVRNLGTPVFPRRLFDAVLDAPGLVSDITLVRDAQGAPISAALTLYHRGTAMPYWGGGTPAARTERANEALYFAVMEHAVARGCARFDFGRSKLDSGPAAYKKNWGFEARPVTHTHWTPPDVAARDVDSLSAANRWKTRLWQRLPLPIANWVGPIVARGLA